MAEQLSSTEDLSDLLHDLLQMHSEMLNIINQIGRITNQTRMLSLNSSIEAARAGSAGRGFAVIAKEMQQFSQRCQDLNNEGRVTINALQHKINNVIGVRTADVAFDLIDKIDRNLFERNCDVQAWATFDIIVNYALDPTLDKQKQVIHLLHNLYEIYEVYHDIIMVDSHGKIVATGVHTDLIGNDVSNQEWFIAPMSQPGCSVSDMYFSSNMNDYTISYSCPIVDPTGACIGVLSTRFNWSFIYDILDKAKVSPEAKVYVINKSGLVIASRDKTEVLIKNLTTEYEAARMVIKGTEYGYLVEEKDGELKGITGYAHTSGYNAYAGKNWSVLVRETF